MEIDSFGLTSTGGVLAAHLSDLVEGDALLQQVHELVESRGDVELGMIASRSAAQFIASVQVSPSLLV